MVAARTAASATGKDMVIRRFLGPGELPWVAFNFSFQHRWPAFHTIDTAFPLGNIMFEGVHFPTLHNVDAYLHGQFVDYMTLPPPEIRRPTHKAGINLTGPNRHHSGLPWAAEP